MPTCALHLFGQISGDKWSQILHSGTLMGPCYSFSNSQLSNDVNTLHPSSSVSMSFLHFTPFLWNYKNKLKQTWQKWHYGILFLFIVYCILYLKIYQFDIATRLIMHFDWLKFQNHLLRNHMCDGIVTLLKCSLYGPLIFFSSYVWFFFCQSSMATTVGQCFYMEPYVNLGRGELKSLKLE